MDIAIFGLGYVGCVTAACLASDGHNVIGVDVNDEKVRVVNSGDSPIIEPGLSRLMKQEVARGRVTATVSPSCAIDQAELILVCVGTPSNADGGLNLGFVRRVCADIGRGLADRDRFVVVAVRSTILPGVAVNQLIPILERESGKEAGVDFGFCVNPEFLREGNAIADFAAPPYTLIGQLDSNSGNRLAALYENIDAPIYRVSLGAAEMVKYASNAFHALKVVFANEIGSLCKIHGVDSHEVMGVFAEDKKLNISPRYLKPGFAFGGSCLPKDLRALLHTARQRSVQLPVLESLLPSNRLQIESAVQLLLAQGKRKVGLIGLSFKANTDDLRESPAVELAERLIGKGFELHIYDKEVLLSRLYGSNRAYIEQTIPHVACLLSTLEETVEASDTIVVTKQLSDEDYDVLINLMQPDQLLFDLVRLDTERIATLKGNYEGIAW